MLRKMGVYPTFAVHATIVGVVVTAASCAFYAKDLGILNVINGAMSVGVFVAFAPALIGLWLLPNSKDKIFRAELYALLIVGIVFMVLGLVYTDNYAALLLKPGGCLWHPGRGP